MVSLGLVGEFFEVRTQVDRDLTTVSEVDRRLGLIKNVGRDRSELPIPLGPVLGADHHRDGWWEADLSTAPLPGAPTVGAESSPDTN
jgi:hypothetical protein